MTIKNEYSTLSPSSQKTVRYLRAVFTQCGIAHSHLSDESLVMYIMEWQMMIDRMGWDRTDVRAWAHMIARTLRNGGAK